MGTLSTSDFLTETKRIAKILDLTDTGIGDGDDTNTPSKGAANALAAIAALSDSDQLTALLPGAVQFAAALKAESMKGACAAWMRVIDAHVGGMNDYLSDNALYVHYSLRDVWTSLRARYVFPPVTELASSSRAAGTWTDAVETNTIDTDSYGSGLIEFYTQAAIGVADIEVTVTGENYDGETVQTSGTIPASTGDTTVVAIAGAVRFVKITSLTVTGGTDGDAFLIRTKFDRDPTGCA